MALPWFHFQRIIFKPTDNQAALIFDRTFGLFKIVTTFEQDVAACKITDVTIISKKNNSLMKMLNIRGPNTDLCSAPTSISNQPPQVEINITTKIPRVNRSNLSWVFII